MPKNILDALPELVESNVITSETAQDIRLYYHRKPAGNQNKLFVIFGILGAVLSGLGIILILAHNWDDLSQRIKAVISFLPLLLGQGLCLYSLLKKKGNFTWRESSAAFLFFGIGASISLVSQVYHIPGELGSFLFIWMLLALPLVYLMRSSIVSLLYIAGITFYCIMTDYSYSEKTHGYWLLLLGILPNYYRLLKTAGNLFFHNWFIGLSVVICLGSVAKSNEELLFPAYLALFAMYYFLADLPVFRNQQLKFDSFLIIGKSGTLFILLTYTFQWFWKSWNMHKQTSEILFSAEFIMAVSLTLVAAALFFRKNLPDNFRNTGIFEILFLVCIPLFFIGSSANIFASILVLLVGLSEINRGNKQNNRGILNFGLLIITVLIACRFFDTEWSFVLRGIMFIIIGAGFFLGNLLMLKKRRNDEK